MAHSSSTYADAGGFFPPSKSLPSPAPSTASSRAAAGLPQPRSKPLAPGSRKEDYARNYVSARLLHVSRRYVKHFGLPEAGDDAVTAGYNSFDEVCADLDDIVNVLWFSGTPTLQVPYLLRVALAVREYASDFAPAPQPTFALLRKLDHCFASLLAGRDARSGAPLPGFGGGGPARGMTRTDMVRCKSLAKETRSLIALLMSGEADVENYEEDDGEDYKNKNRDKENRPTPTLARPGKRRRDESEDATTPAGLGHNVDDIDDDDYDDTEDDVRTENSSPKRRRSDTPPKRPCAPYIKADEEEASLTALRSPHPGGAPEAEVREHATPGVVTTAGKQFHWALEDDDLSDDDEDDKGDKAATGAPLAQQPLPPATTATPADVNIPVPRSAGQPQTPPPGAIDTDMADAGGEDDDDEDEEADAGRGGEEEEDEEEELHMNVAKVYEKTLVELGRVLDEPLVDD